jgi:hypothetical protein
MLWSLRCTFAEFFDEWCQLFCFVRHAMPFHHPFTSLTLVLLQPCPCQPKMSCWCNVGAARFTLQYYKQSVLYKETLHYMNTAFTALFSIECMLKIISFGVRVSRSSAILSKKQNKTKQNKTNRRSHPWPHEPRHPQP